MEKEKDGKSTKYVGKRLRQLRLKLDKNQDEMATALGVSQSYYSAIEIRKRKISDKLAGKIVDIFKVDKDYFTKDTDSKSIEEKSWCYCPHCGKALK